MMRAWEEAFKKLGEEKDRADFDEEFHKETEERVKRISEKEERERRRRSEQKDIQTRKMIRRIEVEEVSEAIKALKSGKAVGIDGITNEILKYGGAELERAIWKLFAKIWEEEEIPASWSQGLIFPIFKGGPAEAQFDPMKYRGITLLSVVGKLYTYILNDRLTKWVEGKKILVEEQAGFRKKRSTVDQLYIMYELIKGRRPKETYCCFLDIQKAYDRVWRGGLWRKMHKYGIQGKMWRVIKNMYKRVESCVLVDGKSTGFFEIEVGVRQGCLLSPMLFLLFINGLAEEIKVRGRGVLDGNIKISILLFADVL
jgi:hypothetical protein